MPQLQINQGPQDALLYDNTRSYFTNVGYVRTSNFQMELRDVDAQSAGTQLGTTAQFVIPKAADLLGPVDLMVDFNTTETSMVSSLGTSQQSIWAAWVEAVGFAMIERIVFSVGSHDIETITGDQLYITNELMRGDEHRFAKDQILKTGRPAIRVDCGTGTSYDVIYDKGSETSSGSGVFHNPTGRLITAALHDGSNLSNLHFVGKKLIIPLGLFFTRHPSQYFPLAAIAGCNDVRISVKFRSLNELLLIKTSQPVVGGMITGAAYTTNPPPISYTPPNFSAIHSCKLRCHYIHVTGPEASLLMNKEHVRLLKLWQPNTVYKTLDSGPTKTFTVDIDLPFLHPVQELIIVIRKNSEMSSSTDASPLSTVYDQKARNKNYFAFQGAGKDPNIESQINSVHEGTGTLNREEAYLKVDSFKLTLNGQDRHPSLAAEGIDRDYLMNRIMPMIHSNTTTNFREIADSSYYRSNIAATAGNTTSPFPSDDFNGLAELMDRKEIYVYPFSLNPEGSNPSGAVNFSKVSHSKLTIKGLAYANAANAGGIEYRFDVWGVHYNWLQIKDGRALTSFA